MLFYITNFFPFVSARDTSIQSGSIYAVDFLFCMVYIACKLVRCYDSVNRISDSKHLLQGQLFAFRPRKSFVVRLFRAACKYTQPRRNHSRARKYANLSIAYFHCSTRRKKTIFEGKLGSILLFITNSFFIQFL